MLASLLTGSGMNCRQFRRDISKYNWALCLASLHGRVYKPMKSTFPAVHQCSKSRAQCIGSLACCQWIASGSRIRCTNVGIAW